jgi:D-glycero-D-manno-heptose 1,7-bisphosphate phosphatase
LPSDLRHAVFLDRDGVLNDPVVRDGKPYPPGAPEELVVPPAAASALGRLKERGFLLIVVTNQPDVGRGTQEQAIVEAINEELQRRLPLDDFFVCYHDDGDGCSCRKPRPGLLLEGAARHGVELSSSYMVGDRWRDVEAGRRAGCKTVWIDLSYEERKPTGYDARVTTLGAAVAWILNDGGTFEGT